MISSKELSRRETLRRINRLEVVHESIESFLKAGRKITICKPSRRGYWYKMKYGMQFREGRVGQ